MIWAAAFSSVGSFWAVIAPPRIPALDDGDLGRGQFLIAGGHFARLDPVEQVTLIGMAGRNGGPRFAPLGHQPP